MSIVKKLQINYDAIPLLATGFSRGKTFMGGAIRLFTGGFKAIPDKKFMNHAFITTENRGWKNCTEETLRGLLPQSLEQYTTPKNMLVAMLYWTGWDDPIRRNEALDYMAYLAIKQGDKTTKIGKYDFRGLFSNIPVIGKWKIFRPDSQAEWCSENCASLHKKFGASWIRDTELDPEELYQLMKKQSDVKTILGFYKY